MVEMWETHDGRPDFVVQADWSYTKEIGLEPESIVLDIYTDRDDARMTMGIRAKHLSYDRGLHIRRVHKDSIYLSDGETFVWIRVREV